jgi:hypothetical protein
VKVEDKEMWIGFFENEGGLVCWTCKEGFPRCDKCGKTQNEQLSHEKGKNDHFFLKDHDRLICLDFARMPNGNL